MVNLLEIPTGWELRDHSLEDWDAPYHGDIDPIRGHIIFRSSQINAQAGAWQLLNDAAQSRESIEASIEFSGDDRLPETIDLRFRSFHTGALLDRYH